MKNQRTTKYSPIIAVWFTIAFVALKHCEGQSVTTNIKPSDVVVTPTAGASLGNAVGLLLTGEFRVPTIDPSKYSITGITGSFSGDAGGAAWGTGQDQYLNATFSLSLALGIGTPIGAGGFTGGTGGGVYISDFSTATLVTLNNFVLPTTTLPNPLDFVAGSAYDAGGYVPVKFQINAGESAYFIGSPQPFLIPSVLVFVGHLGLGVTYDLSQVSSSPGLLPSSDAAPFPTYTQSQLNAGDTIPTAVTNALPAYVVPEPSSICLFGIGVILFFLRIRRQSIEA